VPVEASTEEIEYLCDGASRFFRQPVRPEDVVWSYAGVRPLVDDGSGKPEAATRGYRFELSDESEGAPILSVFGGKITTYRRLAEEAIELLAARLPELAAPGWTASASLPGGDFPLDGQPALVAQLMARHPFLRPEWADRLVKAYGTLATEIVSGDDLGHGLTTGEVRHLIQREWAITADDILWRRTKLGLRFSADQRQALEHFLVQEQPA
jgi:glycerol-3-phosphate dehydrogenase